MTRAVRAQRGERLGIDRVERNQHCIGLLQQRRESLRPRATVVVDQRDVMDELAARSHARNTALLPGRPPT